MSSPILDKEMKIQDYEKVIKKLMFGGRTKGIKLLGGEPTLHSRLFEFIDIAVQKKLFVQIFTNGVLGKEKTNRLSTYGKAIGYTFNVMTPGFLMNKKLREEVTSNIIELGKKSEITLSITLDPFFNLEQFFTTVDPSLLKVISNIRIGLSNPIAGQRNWYTFEQFPKMGLVLTTFMKRARKNGFKGIFHMNCGFTRCMFSSEEFNYLNSEFPFMGWSCFGKESSMDIAVDMSAFHCFPLSEHKRVDLKKISYEEANRRLIKERMMLWAQMKKKVCLTCPFFGYGGDKCPGPCLAFQINERKELEDKEVSIST
jgi:MoaA/NifB/PqqE/SkfB family radical SAM enzyme